MVAKSLEKMERLDEEELKAEIDLSKVIVVDNAASLRMAREYFEDCDHTGVDLEGNLSHKGTIYLI